MKHSFNMKHHLLKFITIFVPKLCDVTFIVEILLKPLKKTIMIQDLMYIGWPIVLSLMFVVISLFLIFRNVSVHENFNTGYSKTLRLTLFIILLIWSASWGLYMIAITMNENTQTDTLEKIFRSAVSAFGLFAFSIDSNVFDGIPEHCLIKDGLSISDKKKGNS